IRDCEWAQSPCGRDDLDFRRWGQALRLSVGGDDRRLLVWLFQRPGCDPDRHLVECGGIAAVASTGTAVLAIDRDPVMAASQPGPLVDARGSAARWWLIAPTLVLFGIINQLDKTKISVLIAVRGFLSDFHLF